VKNQAEINRLRYKKKSEYEKRRTQDIAIKKYKIDWQKMQRIVVNNIFNQNASVISYDSIEKNSVYQLSTNNWLSQTQFDSIRLNLSNIDRSIYFFLLLFLYLQYKTDIEVEVETIFDINIRNDVSILSINNFCRKISALKVQ